jgi:hypothetical protein
MGVDGGMYVVRRELLRPIPPDTILDDFVISMEVIRRGKRVAFEPRAVASENGTPSARQEFRRRVRLAAGAVQACKRGAFPPLGRPIELWQFVSHKLLRWLLPAVLVGLLVSNVWLWDAGAVYQVALAAQGAVYLSAAVGTVSQGFRATRLGGICFFYVMSFVAMAIGTVKGALNLQGAAWNKTGRTPPMPPSMPEFASAASHRKLASQDGRLLN